VIEVGARHWITAEHDLDEGMQQIRREIEALIDDGNVEVRIRLIPHCINGSDRYGQAMELSE
jgi:hypothetical protein